MVNYIPLPAFRAPSGIDFGPLNDGLDVLGKTIERNRLLAEQKELAQSLGKTPTSTSSSSPQYAPTNRLLSSSSPAQYGAANVTDRIIGAESGGNAMARNPRSSATGAGQFINSTWLDTIKRARPDLAQGKSDQELLALRNDPNLSREMTGVYANQNAEALRGGGYEASPGNTYLAHFAGPAGAKAVLGADPSTPVRAVLGDRVVQANPFLGSMTAGDLRSWAEQKMGGGSAPAPQPQSQSASAPRSRLNYAEGMRVAASQGNVDAMLKLQALEQDEANNAQASELRSLQIQGTREQLETAAQKKLAGIAQTIATQTDPNRKAQLVQKLFAANPRIAQTLQQYGVDPNDTDTALRFIIAEARGLQEPTEKARYRASKQGILDTWTGQLESLPAGAGGQDAAEYGTSPQYVRDPKTGKVRIGQLSKAGGMKMVEVDGEVLPGSIDYKDVGTGYIPFNSRSGEQTGPVVPKDLAGAEAQKKVGEATGQAIVDLPKVRGATAVVLGMIESVEKDPYLSSMTGPIQGRLPNLSGDAARVQSKVAQLQGTAFLQAFQEIKGGGAITEVEGAKAEAAKSRLLALNVNDADYPAALKEFKDEVIRLGQLAETKAKGFGSGAVSGPSRGPQPGQVEDGYRFKGGNPGDPNSWEKVQ